MFLPLIRLIEFSFALKSLTHLTTPFWSVAFVWLVTKSKEERECRPIHFVRMCMFFFVFFFFLLEVKMISLCADAGKKEMSIYSGHTAPLIFESLSPHLPCPFGRFIWITLWCVWMCRFKAVSPCPCLVDLNGGRPHLFWFWQLDPFSVIHPGNTLTSQCFSVYFSLFLSSFLKMSWSAQTFSGLGGSELFTLDWSKV